MNNEQFYRGRKIKLETNRTSEGWACKFSVIEFGKPARASSGDYAKGLYGTEEEAQLAALRAAQERIVAEIRETSA